MNARALRGLLPAVERIARDAGEVILRIYGGDFAVRDKADASPVTLADESAEALIVPALHVLSPGLPVVAEEAVSRGELPLEASLHSGFWLVDPLDGTREFVSRNGEFTVNIAFVGHGVPLLGVVYVPVSDTLYSGVVGCGAWIEKGGRRQTMACRAVPPAGVTLACSRSHGDEVALQNWLRATLVAARITAGSSLKFGLLAQGLADVYPRFGRTMEWDTAAGHALLVAAGGSVSDMSGQPLLYGKPGFENPDFVATGRR